MFYLLMPNFFSSSFISLFTLNNIQYELLVHGARGELTSILFLRNIKNRPIDEIMNIIQANNTEYAVKAEVQK